VTYTVAELGSFKETFFENVRILTIVVQIKSAQFVQIKSAQFVHI